MNNLKRIFSLLLVLVMCLSIVPSSVLAASSGDVTYTATPDVATIETSATAQTVVVTVKANQEFDADAMGFTVIVPTGWTLVSVENADLAFEPKHINLANGMFNYATADAENWSTDLVAVITYSAPANVAAGTYELGLDKLVISKDYGMVWQQETKVATNLTVTEPTPVSTVYTATSNVATIETSATAQTVVVTVKANQKFDADAMGFTVIIPDGWTLVSVENAELAFEPKHINLANGMFNYATADAENWSTDLVAVITYSVPANVVAGTYELGLDDLVISKDYGMVWQQETKAATTLTVTEPAPVPVVYTATLDIATIYSYDFVQKVVVTIKANQKFDIDAIGFTTIIPTGWTLESIKNDELLFANGDINLANGKVNYATSDAENWSTDLVAVITYVVPANTAAGTYELGIKDLVISKDYGTVWQQATTANVDLTVKDHVCSGTVVPGQGATCTVDGWKDHYKCSDTNCGKLYSDANCTDEITDLDAWKKGNGKIAAAHDYGTLVNEDPGKHTATELKDGMKAHYFCDECDTYFTEEKVATTKEALAIKNAHAYGTKWDYKGADGHSHVCACGAKEEVLAHTPNITAPTETEDQVCTACEYVIAEKTGHIHKNHLTEVKAKDADCTNDGNKAYYTCSCGKWFTDNTAATEITDKNSVVIKGGHNYGTLVEEDPGKHTATELKDGMKAHYFCDKCDTYFTAEKVATTKEALVIKNAHAYGTEWGYKGADGHAHLCACGAKDEVLAHTPNITAPTETEDQVCTACEYVIAEKTGHIHKNHLTEVKAKDADCTNDGNKAYYTCSCGKWFTDNTAATEITDKNSVVIKGGHNYGTLVAEVPAVHTGAELKAGMKAHYLCDKCNTYFTADKVATTKEALVIAAPTHNFGTLVAEVPAVHTATELKAGMKAHYFCDGCNTYFTEAKVATTKEALVIAAPAHAYGTEWGYKGADGHAHVCACGAKEEVLAHTPNITAPTETEDQVCTACEYVIAEKTGHIHKNHLTEVKAKDADCTNDGNKAYYTCSCGKWFTDNTAATEITDKSSVVIKGGHTYGELVAEVPAVHTATELKAGMKAHYLCEKCGTYFTEEKVATTKEALVIAAPVHVDADNDGKCDVCDKDTGSVRPPQTSDNGMIVVWIIITGISALACLIVIKRRRAYNE